MEMVVVLMAEVEVAKFSLLSLKRLLQITILTWFMIHYSWSSASMLNADHWSAWPHCQWSSTDGSGSGETSGEGSGEEVIVSIISNIIISFTRTSIIISSIIIIVLSIIIAMKLEFRMTNQHHIGHSFYNENQKQSKPQCTKQPNHNDYWHHNHKNLLLYHWRWPRPPL